MVLPMSRSRRRIASPGRRATLQADLFPDNESYVRAVHDQGLAFDLDTLAHGLGRRRMLMVLGGGALGLAACAPSPSTSTSSGSSATPTSSAARGGRDLRGDGWPVPR